MSIITSGNHSYVLTEAVTAVAINEFVRLPLTFPLFYNVSPSSMSDSEVHASVSGLGRLEAKQATGSATKDETVQQFKRTWVHGEYALELDVERAFVDDEKFGFFASLGAELGAAANRGYEEDAAKCFTDAFDGTYITAEDGLSLCNDAHVNADGGNSQDNSGTNALDADGLKTTRTAMRKFTDYRGKRVKITPSLLVTGVDQEEDAVVLVQSGQKPGGNNNDVNMFAGTSLAIWEEITDTNAWFLIDPQLMKRHNWFFIRSPLEFYGSKHHRTMVTTMGAWTRYSYGPQDWRWIYGNNPS